MPTTDDSTLAALEGRLRSGRASEDWIQSVRLDPLAVAIFTRQLATLLQSGVAILRALDALAEQTDQAEMAEVLYTVRDTLSQGTSLSKACSSFRRVFPPLYITMLRVGEKSGALVVCLDRLADWLERDSRLVNRLKSGLTYPLFVLCLSLAITGMLFYFVLPPFLEMLLGLRVPLPLSTRFMYFITRLMHHPAAWLVAAGTALVGYRTLVHYVSQPAGNLRMWQVLLAVPVLGRTLRCYSMVRLCSAASALLHSGADLTSTWSLALEASGDPHLKEDAPALIGHIMEGGEVGQYLSSKAELYPLMLAQLLRVGEESARLGPMMEHLRCFYDQEVDTRLDTLTALLQPLLLLCVSGLLTFSMVSIFLPLYSYLTVL